MSMTMLRALAALLAAIGLAGCLSTQSELFALDGGDDIAAPPGDYLCRSFDSNAAPRIGAARLVRLRRDRRSQYVLLFPDNSRGEPATLHRLKDGRYLVALAHEEDAGEDLYLAAVGAGAGAFRLYAPAPAALITAKPLAAALGATLRHSQFADDLAGPIGAQRAFALALAADPKNWRLAADCRAKSP
jgi:hypothetical protein